MSCKERKIWTTFWLVAFFGGPARADDVLLLDVDGSVRLSRPGWTTLQPVRAGALLRPTDLLDVASDARVIVLCPDLETVWRPPSGKVRGAANGCPSGTRRSLLRDGQRVMAPRGPGGTERVLAPRRAVRDPAPLLRWLPIGEASEYEVKIVRGRRSVWGPVLVQGLETRYPSSPAVRLAFAVEYRVEVRPYQRDNPTKFVASDMPFVVLDNDQRTELASSLERFGQDLDALAKSLAVAARLAGDEVYGEALAGLDQARTVAESAAVTLLGARFAEELGLYAEASRRYGETRQEAEAEGNVLVKTEALEGLARHAGDHGEALKLYQEALDVRTALGDEDGAKRVREAMGELSPG